MQREREGAGEGAGEGEGAGAGTGAGEGEGKGEGAGERDRGLEGEKSAIELRKFARECGLAKITDMSSYLTHQASTDLQEGSVGPIGSVERGERGERSFRESASKRRLMSIVIAPGERIHVAATFNVPLSVTD